MARAVGFDYLHNMRFAVSASGGYLKSSSGEAPSAGFATCGAPGGSVAVAPYREGHYIYTRKQPGIPSMDDITLSRGVAFPDADLWRWFLVVIEGANGYRADVDIDHYHRDKAFSRTTSHYLDQESVINGDGEPDASESEFLKIDGSEIKRRYKLYNAFPVNIKVAGDMDSNNNEISIATMGITYENFKIQHINARTLDFGS